MKKVQAYESEQGELYHTEEQCHKAEIIYYISANQEEAADVLKQNEYSYADITMLEKIAEIIRYLLKYR